MVPSYDDAAPRFSKLAIATLASCALGVAALVAAYVFGTWTAELTRVEVWIGRIAFWTAVVCGPLSVGTGIVAASRLAQPGWAATVSMVLGPLLIAGAGVSVLMTYAV